MNIIEGTFEINFEELKILAFSLRNELKNKINAHYKNLGNRKNFEKRDVFFKQEKQELKLLKQLDIDRSNLYENLLLLLDQEIPKQEKKEVLK